MTDREELVKERLEKVRNLISLLVEKESKHIALTMDEIVSTKEIINSIYLSVPDESDRIELLMAIGKLQKIEENLYDVDINKLDLNKVSGRQGWLLNRTTIAL